MGSFQTLSRANRSIQLEGWTEVDLGFLTLIRIHEDEDPLVFENFQTGDTVGTVVQFLQDWCRRNVRGGFAVSDRKFLFRRPSEAVRFKLTWGGR